MFFLCFFGYALSGPVLWCYARTRRSPAPVALAPREPPSL
jgi:hypothetical protein